MVLWEEPTGPARLHDYTHADENHDDGGERYAGVIGKDMTHTPPDSISIKEAIDVGIVCTAYP